MQHREPVFKQSARLRPGVIWILAFTLVSSLAITAQQVPQSQPNSADLKQQRHAQLVADTTRLLELANELKADVDKSTKDQLSVPVVKKADEVGKLAKKLREEMKP